MCEGTTSKLFPSPRRQPQSSDSHHRSRYRERSQHCEAHVAIRNGNEQRLVEVGSSDQSLQKFFTRQFDTIIRTHTIAAGGTAPTADSSSGSPSPLRSPAACHCALYGKRTFLQPALKGHATELSRNCTGAPFFRSNVHDKSISLLSRRVCH